MKLHPVLRALILVTLTLITGAVGHAAGVDAHRLDTLKALTRDGKYADATLGSRALLAEATAAGERDSLRIAAILDVLVESLWRGGKARQVEASELAQLALGIRERRFGATHREVAAPLTALGNVLLARNDFAGARIPLERALKIRERGLDPADPEIALTLTPLGNLLRRTADFEGARPLLERALAIREKALGPDHPDVASSLGNMGTLYGDLGDYPRARAAYERAVSIREKALGPDHPLVAAAYDNLGRVLRVMGEYAAARAAGERALAINERTLSPDDPAIAGSLQNLGLALRGMGMDAEARPLYERSVSIREQALGPDHPDVANTLNTLANLLRDTGDYAAARPLYERALAIREKALGLDHPDVANSLDNFALLLENSGDNAAARKLFERALQIRERKFGSEHAEVAIALWSLAGAVHNDGDLPAARKLFERALAVWEKTQGPRHSDVALALNDLAGVLAEQGELTAARSFAERGLAVREAAIGLDHPKVAESLEQLAGILTASGDVAGARPLLERGLAIRERTRGHQSPDVASLLYQLARTDAMQGNRAAALDGALEAESISRAHVRITARGLAEREALAYVAARPLSLDLALTLAARGIDGPSRRRVLDAVVKSRAIVLDEMACRHSAIASSLDTVVAGRAERLARRRERLAALLVRGGARGAPEAFQRQRDEARVEMETAERSLAEVSAHFGLEQSRSGAGVDDVASNLPVGSALLAFSRYQAIDLSIPSVEHGRVAAKSGASTTAYVAFVLRAGEHDPEVIDLGSGSRVDERVARWSQDINGSSNASAARAEQAARRSGAALRAALWDPLTPALGTATRVFLVPEGALNRVNLAALPASNGYLLEHGPLLHLLSAERDLVPAAGAHLGKGLLAIGAVDYDTAAPFASSRATLPALAAASPSASGPPSLPQAGNYRGTRSACADLAAVRFEPLRATGTEAHAIAQLWSRDGAARGEAIELRGLWADESSFKRSAPGRRVLHLATHGFFLGNCGTAPAGSRGIGGLVANATPAPHIDGPAENPLRLSGLVFAGANHRGAAAADEDDGILTAEEIASLDLAGTEWVVLSACETGLGEVRAGEGVFGLRRAFQVAGAGTLITSLWPVDDESTREWMNALYEARLQEGLDTAESARQATLSVLRHRRTAGKSTLPFYWGAFVAAGDWR